jgi:hypothetical protein
LRRSIFRSPAIYYNYALAALSVAAVPSLALFVPGVSAVVVPMGTIVPSLWGPAIAVTTIGRPIGTVGCVIIMARLSVVFYVRGVLRAVAGSITTFYPVVPGIISIIVFPYLTIINTI